jgi:predicted ATPase
VYLKKIRLQNIKCFEDLTLEFPHRSGNYAGWNVILGENGRGKSTILRSIALGVLHPFLGTIALGQHEGHFARRGANGKSALAADLLFHAAELRQGGAKVPSYLRRLTFSSLGSAAVTLAAASPSEEALPHALCYGYGPFRRLEGSPRAAPASFQFPEPLSRFVTLFTDEIGLAYATHGLTDLYVASVDPKHSAHHIARQGFREVCKVVNALLPGGVQVSSVSSEGVQFQTPAGVSVTEKELSDGYRSFLAILLDLLRQLLERFGSAFPALLQREGDRVAVVVEAVVLIDEADAHLHPRWQRELGEHLRRAFPNVQFIVTTHSPFIAQAATDGGLFVLRADGGGAVTADQPVDSVRGWTASQILTSPLFGLESTRDPQTESLIREKAALTARERAGNLTPAEKKRLAEVGQQLATLLSAPGETYDEMRRQQDMADYVDRTLDRLNKSKK